MLLVSKLVSDTLLPHQRVRQTQFSERIRHIVPGTTSFCPFFTNVVLSTKFLSYSCALSKIHAPGHGWYVLSQFHSSLHSLSQTVWYPALSSTNVSYMASTVSTTFRTLATLQLPVLGLRMAITIPDEIRVDLPKHLRNILRMTTPTCHRSMFTDLALARQHCIHVEAACEPMT